MAQAARKETHQDYIAEDDITIDAAPEKVWDALTSSESFGKAMFGSKITTDWKVGSPITYSGEWEGKTFEDKGKILELDKPKVFRSTHYSPSTGLPDKPENYHEVTFSLAPAGKGTKVSLRQTNNSSQKSADHSKQNWGMALKSLKKVVEGA